MGSRPDLARHPAWWLGLAAGVLNVNFLLEWLLPHHTPVASTVVSDLAAPGQPWNWAFRLGDAASAVLLLALCALAWRADRSPVWRVATAMLALFAASTLMAVVFPEQCTVSGAGSCAAAATDHGWGDVLHDTISTLGTTCGVLAAAAYAWATRRARSLSRLHLAAFALAGALGLVFITSQAAGHLTWLGWPQRGQILTLSAWYALVGASVARAPTWTSSAPSAPERMRL